MVWFKSYNPGEYYHIIQAPDHSGYVAVGISRDTKDRTQELYDWTGTTDGFVRYNPEAGQPEFTINGQETSQPCDIFDTNEQPNNQFIVTKIDNNGDVDWSYVYGYTDPGSLSHPQEINFQGGVGVDLVSYYQDSDVHYRCVGSYENQWVMFDLDEDGLLEWKYSANESYQNCAMTIDHFLDGSADVFYVGGYINTATASNGFISCFTGSTSNTHEWTKLVNSSFDAGIGANTYNEIFDIEFDHEDNLLVAGLVDLAKPSFSGIHEAAGEGVVYTLTNTTNPASVSHERTKVNIGAIQAYDLKIGVTPTSDNGMAVVSTKVASPWSESDFTTNIINVSAFTPPDWTSTGCDKYNYRYQNWNSNAYVAKYNLDGGEWDLTWEKTIETPGPRGGFPGELKKQECVYSIHEDFDGGLVVCGNTSHNYDDYYLVKIFGECEMEDEAFQWPDELATYGAYWDQQGTTTNYGLTSNLTMSNVTLHVKGALYIPPGKKLTLDNCTIQFADSKRLGIETGIIVLTAGELELNNTTLLTANSSCPYSMWDGITVIGTPTSSDADDQGKLVMDNAKIEHARNAVQLGNGTYSGLGAWQGGGILQAENSTFENNRRDVIFYPHDAAKNDPGATLSYIRNSLFTCTGPLRDPHYVAKGTTQGVGTNIHVTLWDVHGVEIQGNTFQGAAEMPEFVWATGISSLDATYAVDCETKNSSGCVSDANTFEYLKYGITAEATVALYAPKIDGNSFDNISTTGVYLKGIAYADIVNNDFTMDWGPAMYELGEEIVDLNCSQCGTGARAIYLYDCNRYLVEGNTITGNAPVLGGFMGTGIEVYSSSTIFTRNAPNEVYNNTFSELTYGSFGNGYNRGSGISSEGLDMRCGDYFGCVFDVLTTVEPGISSGQGRATNDETTPAGNRFDGCVFDEAEVYNDGNHFDYVHHNNTGSDVLIPANGCYESGNGVSEVSLVDANVNFSKATSCPPRYEHVSRRASASTAYDGAAQAYLNELSVYNNTIDDGNTQNLLAIVTDDKPDAFIQTEFSDASPYVSDAALLALINDKPTACDENILVDILVDNSPLTETVMDAARNRTPAISSTPMATLEAAQTGTSARAILEQQVAETKSARRLAKDEFIRALVQDYGLDTRLDTIVILLGDEDDTASMAELATAYIVDGQTSNAQQHINALGGNPGWADYADHLQNLLDWAVDSVHLDTILHDSNYYQQVQAWADDENSAANIPGRVMLEFLHEILDVDAATGQYVIQEVSVYPEDGPGKHAMRPHDGNNTAREPVDGFAAYPNPFKDQIDFRVTGTAGSCVIVRDIRGAVLSRLPVAQDQRLVSWNSNEVSKGIYIATLVELDKPVKSLKIVKY